MKRLRMLFPIVGVSLCFAVIPVAAAQGRGMGRGAGAGSGQAGRPTTGPGMGHGAGADQAGQAASRNSSRASSMSASQALQKSPQLSSRLQSLLPAGTNLSDAAAGFKNAGQFVAAVHVSHNLGIPFDTLKQEALNQGSLGKALQTLKPDMSKAERKKAMKQAQSEAQQDLEAGDKTES